MSRLSPGRVFALLGDPVAHSLSPRMHNAAFHALGLPAVYVALRVRAADLAPLMHVLAANGGGGNVTVPFKAPAAEVARMLQETTPTWPASPRRCASWVSPRDAAGSSGEPAARPGL